MEKKISLRDRMKSRLKEEKSKGSSHIDLNGKKIEFFNPKEDTYTMTILPYKVTTGSHPHGVGKGDEWYTRPYDLHRNLGVDNNMSAVCLKSFGKKCPICDEGWAMYKESKDKSLLPKQRNLYLVYIEEEADKGVQLFDYSNKGFEEKLKKALEKAEKKGQDEYLEFFDLDVGCTLEVEFEEDKIGENTWYPATSIKFVDRSDIPDEVIEHGIALDKLLVEKTPEELESLLYGNPVESEADEDEEDDLPVTYEDEEEEKPKRMGGERKAPVEEKKEEEPKKEETPSGRRRRGIPKEEDDTPKCPHGHRFGKDCDKKDECTTCEDEVYDKCSEVGND